MTEEYNDHRFSIGEKVLSIDFGVGVILAIEKLQRDKTEYYVIECGRKRSKDYFPVEGNKRVRILSSKLSFEEALASFKFGRCMKNFESKQDRQLFFEKQVNQNTVNLVVARVIELISIKERTPKEQKIIDTMVKSLELEASLIFKININESKKLLSNFLT